MKTGVALVLGLHLLQPPAAMAGSMQVIQKTCAEWRITDTWAFQSRNPDPPWDTSTGKILHSLDLGASRYERYSKLQGAGGYNFHNVLKLSGGKAQIGSFIYGDIRQQDDRSLVEHASDLFLFSPFLLLAELEKRGFAIDTGQDRVSLPETPFAALELDFAEAGKLHSLAITQQNGDVRELEYSDYRENGAVSYPATITMSWNGTRYWEVRLAFLDTEQGCFKRIPSIQGLSINTINNGNARAFSVRELADGIWFIGSAVYYQLFIELDDHIVAVGSVRGVKKRVEALQQHTGSKALRYALVSHHHDDHLEGLAELLELGATLLVAPAHEDIVRSTSGAAAIQIQLVDEHLVIDDGQQRLEIVDIPNAHASHNLVAWLPKAGLLFTADLWVQQPERPIRAALAPTRDLARELRTRKIQPRLFVDPHSPRLNTADDLEIALQKARHYELQFGHLP